MIKPGALHRANGGHLILDANRLLTQPLAWDAVKRALQSRQIGGGIGGVHGRGLRPTDSVGKPSPVRRGLSAGVSGPHAAADRSTPSFRVSRQIASVKL